MDRYSAVHGLLYMLEFLGVLLVSMVTACLLFYAPISIGNSFATHKTLLSVVFYFVIQTVLQIVTVFGFAFSARTVNDVIMPSLASSPTRAAHLLFLSVLGYSLIIGTIRLNLQYHAKPEDFRLPVFFYQFRLVPASCTLQRKLPRS